jgi:glycosyltransferase involved in cell wall biosynthesis
MTQRDEMKHGRHGARRMDGRGPRGWRIDRCDAVDDDRPLLSVVVPMYNEGEVVEKFYARTARVLDRLELRWEIVAVNDGSSDETLERLVRLHRRDGRVKVLDLSRNFGKEVALTAGLDHAAGDAVVPMDADLQDPPEVIADLVQRWREGYEVVYATRLERRGETWLKRLTAGLFYRILHRLVQVEIPRDTGDFRLLSRPAVEALRGCRERRRFMKGLFSWVGFRQARVTYRRDPRLAGRTKWNYRRLGHLAVEGITSFSAAPLQLSTYLGALITLSAFALGGVLAGKVLIGQPISAYPSLLATVLLLGGVQLLAIGILGEYVGRIYDESKHRPLYIVRETLGIGEGASTGAIPQGTRGTRRGEVVVRADGAA